MYSYPFIEQLARNILQHSKAINGRVWMAPFFGSELNSENLEQIVSDTLAGSGPLKQYPLSIILPPISTQPVKGWSTYQVQQLFLVKENQDSGGNIKALDIHTNRSRHSVTQDWHDMRRVATFYLEQLDKLTRREGGRLFRLSERTMPDMVPVTRIGKDKLNGVMANYALQLFEQCTEEDYAPGATDTILVPVGDQHPEHPL